MGWLPCNTTTQGQPGYCREVVSSNGVQFYYGGKFADYDELFAEARSGTRDTVSTGHVSANMFGEDPLYLWSLYSGFYIMIFLVLFTLGYPAAYANWWLGT